VHVALEELLALLGVVELGRERVGAAAAARGAFLGAGLSPTLEDVDGPFVTALGGVRRGGEEGGACGRGDEEGGW